MDIGLLLLRVVLGLVLAAHGAQKLFGWFGGYGLNGTAGWLASMGFRPAKLQAFAAGAAEFGGGLLLALGLATPLGAVAIVSVMLVAVVSAHLGKGFFVTSGGYEYNLVLAAAAAALAFTGPGLYSLDAVLAVPFRAGWETGVAAIVAGLLGGASVLMTRRAPAPAVA